jgi:hypothetical protein
MCVIELSLPVPAANAAEIDTSLFTELTEQQKSDIEAKVTHDVSLILEEQMKAKQ